jgi:hypothetical protein
MWRNYWTVAVRALAKSKTYSFINIAGLAIGMAACIMILLYLNYERSYDSWLPDVENTYELQAWYPHPHDGEPAVVALLVMDVEQDEDAGGHADGEPGDVDDRIGPALRQRPDRDRPIVSPHGD